MASSALYRRWRPQTFGDLLGQEHVTRSLQAAIRDGKSSHAYLFSGPRGTGKTSTARIFAKAINCENGPGEEPDNTCATCLAITQGSSLDVIEIDAASHGGVDDVRDLRESAVLAPAFARRKVYIVDEAHMVSTQGWNAFLKTVEEPPEHVVFVFATTEPSKVLPTILSRCQRFEFRRISTDELAGHLRVICEAENIIADEAALLMIARAAEGGARDAISTLDQLAAAGPVTITDTARLLGVTDHEALFRMSGAIVDQRGGEAIDLIAELVEQGTDLRMFGRNLLEHLRALLLSVQLEKPEQILEVPDEILARYHSQAQRCEPANLYHAMRAVTQALTDSRQGTPARLALEMALLRACIPSIDVTAAAATSRISRIERILSAGAAPAGATAAPLANEPSKTATNSGTVGSAPSNPAPSKHVTSDAKAPKKAAKSEPAPEPDLSSPKGPGAGRVDVDAVINAWPSILDRVRKAARSVHAQLVDAHVVSLEGAVLNIEHPYKAVVENLKTGNSGNVLSKAILEVLGIEVKIRATERAKVGGGEVELNAQNFERETIASSAFDPIDVFKQGFGDDLVVED